MNAKALTSTSGMSREDWLHARTQGIGGSDAAVVLGLSKWKTAFELWLEKTGQSTVQETDNEAAYWGTRLEEVVAQEFMLREGKKVRRVNEILQHPGHPWMIANIDRRVIGENAILECKTSSAFLHADWKDENVPDAYIVQVQHYMAVTGAERAYVAVLIGGNQYKCKTVERDDELINMIIAAEQRFWEFHVLGNNPTVLDGSSVAEKYVKKRFAESDSGKTVELVPTRAKQIEQLIAVKTQIKELETVQKQIENQLKMELADAEVGFVSNYAVNWKPVISERLDNKALKDAHPDIYEKFCKPSISRRFEIKERA